MIFKARPVFLTAAVLVATVAAQPGATRPLTIIVTDRSGAGVPNAHVRIVPAGNSQGPMDTDSKGHLTLNLRPGGYALFVRSPGFKPAANHIEIQPAGAPQTMTVALTVAETGSPTAVLPAAEKGSLLLLTFPYHDPWRLGPADLKAMPQVSVTIHNSHDADETYAGVRLADLLTRAGAPLGSELRGEALANCVVATGSDGYQAVIALAEIDPSFHPGEILVADEMNGKPLDEHSGPIKLVVTEDKRPARAVRNLVTIELKSAP